jgi:hypothetical protein
MQNQISHHRGDAEAGSFVQPAGAGHLTKLGPGTT